MSSPVTAFPVWDLPIRQAAEFNISSQRPQSLYWFVAGLVEKLFNLAEYFGIKGSGYALARATLNYDPDDLAAYYLDFASRADYPGPFDAKGLALTRIGQRSVYMPINVVLYGLGQLELCRKSGSDLHRERFKAMLEWLCENQAASGIWLTSVPKPEFGLHRPYQSAMLQGLGISCLVRGSFLFSEYRYMKSAYRALKPFRTRVEQGGVTAILPEGPFYEEYICRPPCHVLNGFFFAIWGLYDLVRLEDHAEARQLWQDGVATIVKLLSHYDIGYWSLYHIPGEPNPATPKYHDLHIEQLRVMYRLTGEDTFSEYARRWQEYTDEFSNALKTLPAKLRWIASRK